MNALFDDIGPLSMLAQQYFNAKYEEEKYKRQKEEFKQKIVEALKRKTGKMDKAAFDSFVNSTDVIPNTAEVTVFKKTYTSWDSKYLEKTLTPAQLKKAHKTSYGSEARITPKG